MIRPVTTAPFPRFVRRSTAATRAIPIAMGAPPPKPARAALAGFTGRAGQVAEILTQRHRLLLVRSGPDLEATGALAVARLLMLPHIAIDLRGWSAPDAASITAGAAIRAWRPRGNRTRPDPERPVLARIDVMVDDTEAAKAAWASLAPAISAAHYARDLVAEPSNTLTPTSFAERLRAFADHGVEVEIIDHHRLADLGCGGLLAVGRASVHPPCMAVLRWRGTIPAAPVLFVGKGITFDTGGVSIKPADHMWDMRADMAGAAAAAAALLALALRRSPAPAAAVLPLAENMLGAASFRPGDVLSLHSGTTVEIVDTDAEGRLILADALAWGIRTIQPQAVIDLATLTGSIVTALGHHMAGLFANDDLLAAHTAAAGAACQEHAWRMPLTEGYEDVLESDIADLRQCSDGTRQPDACHAAAFLGHFVGQTPWVHLDIAGVESQEKADDRYAAGPTGWGVRLLDRLIRDRFEDPHRA